MTYLKVDVAIGAPDKWVKDFCQASPADRSIMLAELMWGYSDGQEGIDVSFSEPVLDEPKNVKANQVCAES